MVLLLFTIYSAVIVLVSFVLLFVRLILICILFILATFCALYTMTEQMELEGTLNIYELAKLYHIKRPGIWRHNVRLKI